MSVDPDHPDRPRTAFERLYRAGLVLTLGLIVVHFALITVTVLPDNALSSAGDDFAVRYVEPGLAQKWSLFAPDPINGDLHVLARGRFQEGDWTGWEEIYRPVAHEVRSRPFSPRALVRVSLLRSAVVPFKEWLSDRSEKRTEKLLKQWQAPETKPAEVLSLERTASGEIEQRYPERDFDEVQVRLLLTHLRGTELEDEPLARLTLLESPFHQSARAIGRR